MHGLFSPFTCSRTGPKQQRAKTGNPPISISSCIHPFTTKTCTVALAISYTNDRRLTTDNRLTQIPRRPTHDCQPRTVNWQLPTTLSRIAWCFRSRHLSLVTSPLIPCRFASCHAPERRAGHLQSTPLHSHTRMCHPSSAFGAAESLIPDMALFVLLWAYS